MNLFKGGGGYEEIVDIFLGQLQIGLFWGSFLYILGVFKAKVHNGNVFGGSQNFKFFFSFFFGGWGVGGVGMPYIPIFRVGVNSRCMKKY